MSGNAEQRDMQGHCGCKSEFADSTATGASPSAEGASSAAHDLGSPMTVHQVTQFLGCSAWTVRQRYLRQGLPHLRACASGKLIFFREQVIGWILKRQQQRQKGGQLR